MGSGFARMRNDVDMVTAVGKVRRRLQDAQESVVMVRVCRHSDPEMVSGFVVDIGRKWVLLVRTMDGGFTDGHIAIRLSDIRKVSKDTSFEGRFARTLPDWPPRAPHEEPIDLDRTRGLLRSFGTPGALVGIESTHRTSSTWIGIPNDIVGRWFYLWEVRPDASWHEQPLGYRLRKIVMVYSGSHYLRGLAAVAGEPPAGAEDWSEVAVRGRHGEMEP